MPIDGGLATHLELLGEDISGSLWSARLLVDSPDSIVRAHRDFIDAGARVVISASYQVSRAGFRAAGMTEAAADTALVRSIHLAREAVADQGDTGSTLVAASVGPYGAITHDGAEYRGRYGLSREELIDFHGQRLEVLVGAGPDLLAVETIPDAEEADAIARVLEDFAEIPAWVTFSCGDGARTWAGQPIEEAIAAATTAENVAAVGINCVAPGLVTELLTRIRAVTPVPLVAYPNAGRVWLPGTETWSDPPDDAADDAVNGDWPVKEWVERGAVLIGGCCCVAPTDIASLALELTEC
jgi:homocysteine S-methyltransferase